MAQIQYNERLRCDAVVAKLADALDLGSSDASRAGSSPVDRRAPRGHLEVAFVFLKGARSLKGKAS